LDGLALAGALHPDVMPDKGITDSAATVTALPPNATVKFPDCVTQRPPMPAEG